MKLVQKPAVNAPFLFSRFASRRLAHLLIRNVPAAVLDALRARARERGRSVQAEALDALQHGVQPMGRSLVEWLQTVADPKIDVEAGLRAIRETRDER